MQMRKARHRARRAASLGHGGAGGVRHCWEAGAKVIVSRLGTGRASVTVVPGKVLFKAPSPEAPVSSTRSPHILPSLNQHKKQQFVSQEPLITQQYLLGSDTPSLIHPSTHLHNSY